MVFNLDPAATTFEKSPASGEAEPGCHLAIRLTAD